MASKELAKRARLARLRAGFERESQAAKVIGCSRPLVIRWENGEAGAIGNQYLLKAARAYRVNPAWLALEVSDDGYPWSSGSDVTQVADAATPASHVRFPLLEGFAGMGRGDYVGDYPEVVQWIEVTREWASQKLRNVPHDAVRVITGRGDSMRGAYNDGDLIFVDTRFKQFNGDAAYCYRFDGLVQIKRLQAIGGGRVRILSENPKYPTIEVAITELEIGGRAIAAWTLTEF